MKFLSIPQAAAKIGCSRGHVYNLIAKQKLKRYNVALTGSKIRVDESDVERYMREAEQPVAGDAA